MTIIRQHLDEEETLVPDIEYEKIFLSECYGVYLTRRGTSDPINKDRHICFGFLVEDDLNWSISDRASSTAWLPEMIDLLKFVNKWLKRNAKPDMHEGTQYGWKFKK